MIEYKGFKIKELSAGDFDAYHNVFMGFALLEDGRSCECHFWDESSISYLALADHACRLCCHFGDCTNWVITKTGTSQGRPWCGVIGTPDEYLEPARANDEGKVENCRFFHK